MMSLSRDVTLPASPFRSMPWIRVGMAFLFVMVGNLVVPWFTWNSNLMGSDPAMWFYGGILLTEVSMLGGVMAWKFGVPEWRFFYGLFANLLIVFAGIVALMMCDSFSQRDGLSYLYLVLPLMTGIAVADFLVLRWRRRSLFGPIRTTADKIAAEQANRSFQFSTKFLFGLMMLAGFLFGMVNMILRFEGTGTRPFTNYASHPLWYLMILLALFWTIHATSMQASLSDSPWGWGIVSVTVAVGGTEVIRVIESFKNSVKLDYLNWEFAMIVSGFFVAHWVLGLTLRWMGWRLKTC
jgi:hypothetical protein